MLHKRPSPDEVAATLMRLARSVATGRSIAPADVARALAEGEEDWQSHLLAVRQTAIDLARAGNLVILRKGKPVDPDEFKGVYRIALPAEADIASNDEG